MVKTHNRIRRTLVIAMLVLVLTSMSVPVQVHAGSGHIRVYNLKSGKVIEPRKRYRIRYKVKGRYRKKESPVQIIQSTHHFGHPQGHSESP